MTKIEKAAGQGIKPPVKRKRLTNNTVYGCRYFRAVQALGVRSDCTKITTAVNRVVRKTLTHNTVYGCRYFRAVQALGVRSATRLIGKSANPGSTEITT